MAGSRRPDSLRPTRGSRGRVAALAAITITVGVSGLIAFAAASCSRSTQPQEQKPPVVGADPAVAMTRLRAFEDDQRSRANFLETAAQEQAFGADPYDLVEVPSLGNGRVAGILRGRNALVIFDASSLTEIARATTPASPSALTIDHNTGDILVASELEPVIARYRLSKGGDHAAKTIQRLPDITLDGVAGARDIITTADGAIHIVEEHDDRLITLTTNAKRQERTVPRGPLRLATAGDNLFLLSLLDHTLSVVGKGSTKIDGPYWGFDVRSISGSDGDALIVAGGVEDHPLDRTGGFFGYVDSFVYVYRFFAKTNELRKVAAINVGERGLIIPKAIAFSVAAKTTQHAREPVVALITSYGGAKALRLEWRDGEDAGQPTIAAVLDASPGASALIATSDGGFIAANPLLDAWVAFGPNGEQTRVVHPDPSLDLDTGKDTRTDHERIGEALFFTSLMAPTSESGGSKSRFTCETCHFEGYVDGRVHHTGRGDVHASTKPLVGLFNNRPHFSRALDPDLSSVAENEFRVAGAPSAADPHFDIDARDIPWLADLGIEQRRYDASELRISLMAFLMSWTHRSNPRAFSRAAFTNQERKGAIAFRDRCEQCHEARAASDVASSRVPFDQWESLIFSRGGGDSHLVWASNEYEMTGVVPYVHDRGARVPSLRRLYKKKPYFTNGSAPDIASVVRLARWSGKDGGGSSNKAAFTHDGTTEGKALDEDTIRAIAAFVDLL